MPSGIARWSRALAASTAGLGGGLLAAAIRNAWTRPTSIDFHVFYESAAAWRAGTDLYATAHAFPNLNPPQMAILMAPLTWLAPQAALGVWLVINLGASLAAAAIIWRELGLPRTFVAIATGVAAAGLCTGVPFGIEEGQPTGLFILVVTIAWAAVRRRDSFAAGALLGAFVTVKPFFGALLLAAARRRQWKTLAGAAAGGACVVLGALALAGPAAFARWIAVGSQVSWFAHPLNASLFGLVVRTGAPGFVWVGASVLVGLLTIAALIGADEVDAEWVACGLLGLLVSPLGWIYYVPLLAGPLVAVMLRQPRLLFAAVGLIWPVPVLVWSAPPTAFGRMALSSLPVWSLLAIWAALVLSLCRPGSDAVWESADTAVSGRPGAPLQA